MTRRPLLLGPADQLDRAAGGHVAEMDVPAGELRQQDVAGHHDLLRRGRDPLEAEPGGDQSLVHRAAGGERRLLAVVGDRDAEGAGVLQRGAHQVAGGDRLAVVAHRHRAGADQLAELGELLSLLSQRHRADRIDPRLRRALRLAHDEADRGLVVGDGVGVRHGAHRGEAAGRRRHRAGGHGLQILLPRLAQVHVQIDQPRRDHLPRRLHHERVVRPAQVAAERLHLAVGDEEVGRPRRCCATGSITRPPRIRIGRTLFPSPAGMRPVGRPAREQVEHRHPHRDAVGHLRAGSRCGGRRPRRCRSRRRGSSGRDGG